MTGLRSMSAGMGSTADPEAARIGEQAAGSVGEEAQLSARAPPPPPAEPRGVAGPGSPASHAPALLSAIVGDQPRGRMRFSSTHQPAAAAKRSYRSCEYEPNPEKRRKILWRSLKSLRTNLEVIERATGTPIVLLCSTRTDAKTGHPVVQHVRDPLCACRASLRSSETRTLLRAAGAGEARLGSHACLLERPALQTHAHCHLGR